MYQNYIFDFYGTLVDVEFETEAKLVWRKMSHFMGYQGAIYTEADLEAAYNKYRERYLARVKGTDYPEIDDVDVFYKLYKDAGIKASPQLTRQTVRAYRAMTTRKLEVYDSVIETLETLKKQKKKLYLCSNAQRAFIKPELKMVDLKQYFEKIYISSDMNMRKPEAKILKRILEENNLKKKETIYIGNDYVEDIKMANKEGVDCLYIHTASSNIKVKKESAKYEIMDGRHKNILKLLS